MKKEDEIIQEMYELRLKVLEKRENEKIELRTLSNPGNLSLDNAPSEKDLNAITGKLHSQKELQEKAREFVESSFNSMKEWREMELEMTRDSSQLEQTKEGILSKVSTYIERKTNQPVQEKTNKENNQNKPSLSERFKKIAEHEQQQEKDRGIDR